jgi:hypothetical protein
MMERKRFNAVNAIIPAPLVAIAVGTGNKETMQHRQEDGPLHIKLELPIFQEIADNLADPQFLPETLKNKGRAYLLGCGPDVGIIPGRENHHNSLGKSGEGTNDGFDAATCLKLIHTADGGDDALGDLFPLAAVFDELEVFIAA